MKIAVLRFKLIQFYYAFARENLWTDSYHSIFYFLPYFSFFIYLISKVMMENKWWGFLQLIIWSTFTFIRIKL